MKDIFQKIEYHYDFCLVFMSLMNHWFIGIIEKMVGLPKPRDLSINNGKFKVDYGVYVDDSAITIYGALKGEVCIVITPKGFLKLFCNAHFLA
jgi:hypothetical protein